MTAFQEELASTIYNNSRFQQDFNNLLRIFFLKHSNQEKIQINHDVAMIRRLAESAIIMATSPEENHKKTALELATLLLESQIDAPGLASVMKLVCARLGNIPTIKLIPQTSSYLPKSLEVESEIKIRENTIIINNQPLQLTQFQLESFNLFSQGLSVSLSAPTSAGKSFLITHFIASEFTKHDEFSALILVPTRALIRQLSTDLVNVFNHYKLNNIELVISSIENTQKDERSRKRVFIITQERLQAILYNWKTRPRFNLLIVDESQKIGDKQRGIILEDMLYEITALQSDIQSIFLSPLSSNPEFLFDIIGADSKNSSVRSVTSPVAQYVYSVSTRRDMPNDIRISRLDSNRELPILSIQSAIPIPSTKYERLAYISFFLGSGSNNIIYASGPSEAERIALSLSKNENIPIKSNQDVIEMTNSLKILIHKDYHLVQCLSKGVGYHYGSMPDIARIGVEDLFRKEAISYIACTSTLLEGVNLPAKNIFIENPRLGLNPMDDSSFWNLAGRAGRLMKDLSGNVYCINQDRWDRPVINRRREYKIELN